jgi:hypothetical protein
MRTIIDRLGPFDLELPQRISHPGLLGRSPDHGLRSRCGDCRAAGVEKVLPPSRRQDKEGARHRALQLFPAAHNALARKKNHGRGEAILFALYGLRASPAMPVPEQLEFPLEAKIAGL